MITEVTRAARRANIEGRLKELDALTDAMNVQLEQFANRHPLPRLVTDTAELRQTSETIISVLGKLKETIEDEIK